jgi:hypothetical protein
MFQIVVRGCKKVHMETDATPSRTERAYAAVIAVLVPLFFVLMWLGGSVKNGAVDVPAVKTEGKNLLAFIGVLSLALWVGNRLPKRIAPTRNSLAAGFIRFGIPLFALTTVYFWIYPTSISFAEHIGSNLLFAVIVAIAARQTHST